MTSVTLPISIRGRTTKVIFDNDKNYEDFVILFEKQDHFDEDKPDDSDEDLSSSDDDEESRKRKKNNAKNKKPKKKYRPANNQTILTPIDSTFFILRGSLGRQVTSPVFQYTLEIEIIDNVSPVPGFDPILTSFRIVKIVGGNSRPICASIIRKALKNSCYFKFRTTANFLHETYRRHTPIEKAHYRKLITDKLFGVNSSKEPILYETVKKMTFPTKSEMPYVLRNLHRTPRYYEMVNIYGGEIVDNLSNEQIDQLVSFDAEIMPHVPFLGMIRNMELFQQQCEECDPKIREEVMVSVGAANIYWELMKRFRRFNCYCLTERVSSSRTQNDLSDRQWKEEELKVIKKNAPNVIIGTSSNGIDHFLKIKNQDELEDSIIDLLKATKNVELREFDVDDDIRFVSWIKGRLQEIQLKRQIPLIVTLSEKRMHYLRNTLKGVCGNIFYYSTISSQISPSYSQIIFLDRAHEADLFTMNSFLRDCDKWKVRNLIMIGTSKGTSTGIGHPFRDMCKSKAFDIYKPGRLQRYPWKIRDDKLILPILTLTQWMQKEMDTQECLVATTLETKKTLVSVHKIKQDRVKLWHEFDPKAPVARVHIFISTDTHKFELVRLFHCIPSSISDPPEGHVQFVVEDMHVMDPDAAVSALFERQNKWRGKPYETHMGIKLRSEFVKETTHNPQSSCEEHV